jgi:hypothetical protein
MDEGLEEIVYGDDEKCELLNKYFSFISSLEDANIPLPDIELKTNNFLRDIVLSPLVLHPELYFGEGVYYYILYSI